LLFFGNANNPLVTAQNVATKSSAQGEKPVKLRPFGKIRAPELHGGYGWLNTQRPLKLSELRGKFVILDFWTYCCINCLHILPDLKKLEAKYAQELVVIGVHSAKFTNEKEAENIRQAILRYDIEHPVINDSDFDIWQSYTVHAWPTLVLIDPEGYIVNIFPGEGNYEAIDYTLTQLIAEYRNTGKLNEKPIKFRLEKERVKPGPLSFPGKVLADATGQRLFISDTNHNRIVITTLTGNLLDIIGNGQPGQIDGDYALATFNHPQGVTLSADGKILYVADTENHLIRQVDLTRKQVTTIAGTGEQSLRFNEAGLPRKISLNSPWDLRLVQNYLFIAMAGFHQIWLLDLKEQKIGPFAGTGQEARTDGDRRRATFAQPSGLAFNGARTLFVADSEVSTIRAVEIAAKGEVQTVAGSGDLFGFGDRDGEAAAARFQHPLAVEYWAGQLYVADTYNHKIKVIDLQTGNSKTLFGSGKPGDDNGKKPKFYEPSGLSATNDKLYIADTNNHVIRLADLKTQEVTTLNLTGVTPPTTVLATSTRNFLPNREEISAPKTKLAPGKGELLVDVYLPRGFHLNPESMHSYQLKITGNGLQINDLARTTADLILPLKIPFEALANSAETVLTLQLTLYYCPINDQGACRVKSLVWQLPIIVDPQTTESQLKLNYNIKD
jgi:DNA-binding beta-propeller fold protein YncE